MATKTASKKAAPKKAPAKKSAPKKSSVSSNGKVKATSEAASGLRELFEDSLKDIYWAEKALTKALPKMAKNATSQELIDAITEHTEITKEHVARLEQVFEQIGKKAQAKKCDAMEGLIKEGEGIMEETEEGVVRDAGIIAASQKIEHYEIATYGTLVSFAKILGEDESAGILEETLKEEKEADSILTEVAESAVNIEAADEDEEEEEK
jgi:ferritin-like metal-binding protein YciE